MNEREILGKNVRRYREYKGLKKEELADKIKVSAKTIERLELGKELTRNFGLNHLFNICKTLDVTLEELVIRNTIIIHNHFRNCDFSPEDRKQYRMLKKYGFNGLFLMYCHRTNKTYDIEDEGKSK